MQSLKRFKKYKPHAIIGLLILTIAVLVFWPRIVITVNSGEAGVLYSRFLGGTVETKVYGEGVHLIPPWDIMYIYDVRMQEYSTDFPVLTKDGLTVTVSASIRFHPRREVLPLLHKYVGPDYRRKLVYPIFVSSIREIVGSYRPQDLYTTARQQIQDDILVEAVEEMGRVPISVNAVIVKRIQLPATINMAIERKVTEEQAYLTYRYILLRTREEIKRQLMQALAIARVQAIINPGLTENYLRLRGVEATLKLAQSPNTKFVIVGGKDGLPLILNPDAPGAAPPAPEAELPQIKPPAPQQPQATPAPKPEETKPEGKESGVDWLNLWRELTGIDVILSRMGTDSHSDIFEKKLLPPTTMAPRQPSLSGVPDTPSRNFPEMIDREAPGKYPFPSQSSPPIKFPDPNNPGGSPGEDK